MKNLKNKSKGVTLLELLLSLAIIGIILIIATRFYTSSSESKRLADLNDQIGIIQNAVNRWSVNHQNPAAGLTSTTTFKDFVEHGYLPSSYYKDETTKLINPWGGLMKVDFSSNYTRLELQEIPKEAAKKIIATYQKILCQKYTNPDITACNDENNNCTINFYFINSCS